MATRVIAYLDKTVVRITGVSVHGLDPRQLETAMGRAVGRQVRVIGVTGDAIDMDVYGLTPEAVLRDSDGIVTAVAAVEGIRAKEVVEIDANDATVRVNVADIPKGQLKSCVRERWQDLDGTSGDHTDRR